MTKKTTPRDPYYIKDPQLEWVPPLKVSLGSSAPHLRFSGSYMDHKNAGQRPEYYTPADSKLWAQYARGAREAIDKIIGEEGRSIIVPDETIFSWRMLCEMYEAALKVLRANGTPEAARDAAQKHLGECQYKTARAVLREAVDNAKNDKEKSDLISEFFETQWDHIPEMKYGS